MTKETSKIAKGLEADTDSNGIRAKARKGEHRIARETSGQTLEGMYKQ
jgi:hypothetical protein